MKKILAIMLVFLLSFAAFAQGNGETQGEEGLFGNSNLLVENGAKTALENNGENERASSSENVAGNEAKTAVNALAANALNNAQLAENQYQESSDVTYDEAYVNALKEALKNSTEIMEKQVEMIASLEQEVKSLQNKNENLASALEEAKETLISVRESLLTAQADLKASNKEINSMRNKKVLIGVYGGSNTSFKGYQIGVIIGGKIGPGFINGIVDANPKTGVLNFNLGYSVSF